MSLYVSRWRYSPCLIVSPDIISGSANRNLMIYYQTIDKNRVYKDRVNLQMSRSCQHTCRLGQSRQGRAMIFLLGHRKELNRPVGLQRLKISSFENLFPHHIIMRTTSMRQNRPHWEKHPKRGLNGIFLDWGVEKTQNVSHPQHPGIQGPVWNEDKLSIAL